MLEHEEAKALVRKMMRENPGATVTQLAEMAPEQYLGVSSQSAKAKSWMTWAFEAAIRPVFEEIEDETVTVMHL